MKTRPYYDEIEEAFSDGNTLRSIELFLLRSLGTALQEEYVQEYINHLITKSILRHIQNKEIVLDDI
ncbi:hypothetical protein DIDNDMLP_00272 [Klebsiella phage KP13-7]|uniref:hypothetical protein n=1 Tax=Klebsiella phage K64-1 TaxID=1439894 RepID=UPI00248C7CB3|nr:hypothetical protein ACQ27_gp483 [Klebsiella phage K64-1]UYL05257.1 hypothetical protein DIDNDMLP_00272 [Klebsiella phage KP13-7]